MLIVRKKLHWNLFVASEQIVNANDVTAHVAPPLLSYKAHLPLEWHCEKSSGRQKVFAIKCLWQLQSSSVDSGTLLSRQIMQKLCLFGGSDVSPDAVVL